MNTYTKNELEEAILIVSSTISICEKVHDKNNLHFKIIDN